MPDIVLFGATGFTGRLTAAALARRGASFALAGRDPGKLERVAEETGAGDVRRADATSPATVLDAVRGARVLLTCVGPFASLGWAAVDAALEGGVHYVDSCGEGTFVRALLRRDAAARSAGIAIAPALGFDEAPCDLAVAVAVEGLDRPRVVATYAVPTTASVGTLRSALGIFLESGWCVDDGVPRRFYAGDETRFAPMPPPLGPKPAFSAPLAIGDLAPLHAEMDSFKPYVTGGRARAAAARWGRPAAARLLATRPVAQLVDAALARLPEGPDDRARRKRWTILVEARSGGRWRNVALQGEDVYGLTAELLAAGAIVIAAAGYDRAGVLSPVQALGAEVLKKELEACGVAMTVFDGA